MYIYKNAFFNLMRNLGRNILIAVIIFAVITTTVVALTINNTAGAVIDDYRERFGSEVTITFDIQSMMSGMAGGLGGGGFARGGMGQIQIDTDLMLILAESELLQTSAATARLAANSETVRAIDQSDSDDGEGGDNGLMVSGERIRGAAGVSLGSVGNFNIIGDDWEAFQDGSRVLLDGGRFPENDGEAVISYELAEENGLSVGDSVIFQVRMSRDIPEDLNTDDWYEGYEVTIGGVLYTAFEMMEETFSLRRTAEIKFEISGIYFDANPEYANDFMSGMAALNARNEVHATIGALLNLREPDETGLILNVTYYLKSPDLLEDFEAFARANGLSDSFLVTTDMASYETIVGPVVGMKNISLTFMIIILILGAAVLILLTSIAVRERKYEIGVLRAMGMKKRKVAAGLLAELFILTVVCLVVGVGVGSAAAQPAADILISQQAEAAQSAAPEQSMFGGMGGRMGSIRGIGGLLGQQNIAVPLDEIAVSIGVGTIGQIIGIALLLSAFAGLIAVSRITKYEPIKILMERN